MEPSRASSSHSESRFELVDDQIKSEHLAASSRPATAEPVSLPPKSSSTPIPSTEPTEPASAPPPGSTPKKKGTASVLKRPAKRPKTGVAKNTKKAKSGVNNAATPEELSADEESDNGPYCICRGPDDHRWMIFCESCEDWFHGTCIKLDKDVGENLVEKFICPNCSKKYKNLTTIYKKSCGIPSCRKPARLKDEKQPSVFCSHEHAQIWWERMVSKLPRRFSELEFTDRLSQEEFMAVLTSDLSGVDDDGMWRLTKTSFVSKPPVDGNEDMLSNEEQIYVKTAASLKQRLNEETVLCHQMLSLVEMAQERRKAAISAGKFGEDICGYDGRLDTVMARDAFAAYVASPDGITAFQTSSLQDPLGEGDQVRGMCEKKRCKTHAGWQKLLALGIKHQIREVAGQAEEVGEEERIVREAAAERSGRRQAEKNWIEVLEA